MPIIQRVGFTGTQKGMSVYQNSALRMELYVYRYPNSEFHHGDCFGADEQAHAIARELGLKIMLHIPVNAINRAFCEGDETFGPLPYLDRNEEIVKCTDILIATPFEVIEQLRSGTWFTIRCARKRRSPIIIIQPDGTRLREPSIGRVVS